MYTCPYCNAKGVGNSLIRYHFDKCKMLTQNRKNERFYKITFKDGTEEIVNNIGAFCKHHHISNQHLRKGQHKKLFMEILEGIEPEQLPNVKIYNAYDYKEPKALVKPNTTKEWEIHFPDGRKEIHKGLIEFAKEYNLTHTSLRKVADGKEHIIKVLNVLSYLFLKSSFFH